MTQSISRKIKLFGIGIAAILLIATVAFGQGEESAKNSKDKTTRSNAKVNPTSLGMELSIPLGNAPGRAGNSMPINFMYSSKVWHVNSYNVPEDGHAVYWASPNYGVDSVSGWTTSLQKPYFEDTSLRKYSPQTPNPIPIGYNYQLIPKVTLHLMDGSAVELAASLTPITAYYGQTEPYYGTYYSFDGSNLKLVTTNPVGAILYMPDGSRYDWGNPLKYVDRNGNTMIFQVDATTGKPEWVDTLGRLILLPPGIPVDSNNQQIAGNVDYNVPTMPNQTMKWTFKWKKLRDSFGNLNGTYQVKQLLQLFPNNVYPPMSTGQHDPVVLNELVQPDGRSYKFYYNEWGEIEKIIYPTGSTEKFTYSQFGPFSFGGRGQALTRQGNRGVATRVVSMDSNPANDLTWQYTIPTDAITLAAASPYTVRTTNPDGTKTERLLFTDGNNGDSVYLFLPSQMGGKEYESRFFDSNGTLKRRELTKWSGASYGTNAPINAYAKVDKKTSITIEGSSALAQNQTMAYDSYLNVTRQTIFDYTVPDLTTAQTAGIDSFLSGTALKTAQTTYVTDTNYTSRQMVSLSNSSTVRQGDENGTIVAQSQTVYDDASYGIVSSGTLSGSAAGTWIDPNTTYRANPSTSKVWKNTDNTWIATHAQFDQYGNMRRSIDALGNASEIEYSSDYACAYPTLTRTAVPDPNNTGYGSTSAFTTTAVYDFTTGLPTSVTDANSQTTTIEYNDPLLRPTKTIAPNGQQTITEYGAGTSASTRFVKVRSQIDAANWKEGYSWFDGLGRTIKSQSVDNTGDVFVESQFDTVGRPWKTSNPYRLSDTPVWTTNVYDEASRIKEIITPDGAKVQTAYSVATTGTNFGTVVTVTDQALKQRRSVTNALGQLTRVDEPTDTGGLGTVSTPNQPTNYAYDTLSNLTTVSQGAQTRTFSYNSLSRLLNATNPESGTISYAYDNNGNLTTKTDARNITTSYAYDALNRVLTRNYSDGTTPNVTYFYDNLPNAKGKLTKVASSVSTTEYTSFDILGRVTGHKQTTDGTAYTTGYTYKLSGALDEETYPSGRVVKNVLNNNGDLSIVESKKNANSGYFNYAKKFTYTAAGAVSSMQLGNGKWESTQFNNRLQPTQIALGTTQNATDKLKLNYTYGSTANNGNVLTQTITVPTVGSNPGFTATQNYTYDSLNRLDDANETVSGQTWRQDFTYDRYGNRNFVTANTTTLGSCPTAQCNPTISATNNRFNSGQGYAYDLAGNTTADAQSRTFVYDGENKQTTVSGPGGTIGQYFYDGDGKRVKKYVPSTGETTIFVYDAGGKLVAEYSTVVAAAIDAKVSYLTSDHLGSPRITLDANGATISRRDFHPFGEEVFTAQRTQALNYSPDNTRRKFTGYERDNETNLDYAKARMFGSGFGRFTSPDPIMMTKDRLADPQSINLYVYARNNPLKYVDPNGEEFKGTDGKKVIIEERDGQLVITSNNASKDLIRLVGLVNGSGSSTALSQFNRLNAHKTMVNFAFGDKDPQGVALARHQPHGTRPDGTKGALEFKDGKFQGEVDIVKDSKGNEVYAEATITIFEGEYKQGGATQNEVNDEMTATFGHESEHDLDLKQVQETKNGTYRDSVYHARNPDGSPATGSPYWMNQQISREIREFRSRPKCPPGHMCF